MLVRIHAGQALRSGVPRRNKSFIAAFVESVRQQVKQNKELQSNVKRLQAEAGKVADSDALKKAKEVYEKARSDVNQQKSAGSEKLKAHAETISRVAGNVGSTVRDAADRVAKSPVGRISKQTVSGDTFVSGTRHVSLTKFSLRLD